MASLLRKQNTPLLQKTCPHATRPLLTSPCFTPSHHVAQTLLPAHRSSHLLCPVTQLLAPRRELPGPRGRRRYALPVLLQTPGLFTLTPPTGRVFSYPVHETWEFTSEYPIRSTFPLWLAYGWPMYILRWLWEGFGYDVSPSVVYWTLRVLMLSLSVVMEDWAIHELVASPRARRIAVMLVASSYVTWTFQTHTFSNSLETLLVLWSLVLIQRITDDKVRLRHTLAHLAHAANPTCRSAPAS